MFIVKKGIKQETKQNCYFKEFCMWRKHCKRNEYLPRTCGKGMQLLSMEFQVNAKHIWQLCKHNIIGNTLFYIYHRVKKK